MKKDDKQLLILGAVLILLLLLAKKYKESVTATIGGLDTRRTPTNIVGPLPEQVDSLRDYSVCGVSADVLNKGLPIRWCVHPTTGEEIAYDDFPNPDATHVQIISRDSGFVARSNYLNGVST